MRAIQVQDEDQGRARFQFVNFATAGLMAVIALSALAGWVFGIPVLVALSPHYPPAPFNSALSFAVLAAGMATTGQGGGWPSRICAMLGFAMGGLTIFEVFLNISVGIDTWHGYYQHGTGSLHPGRIANIAAISLISLAIAIWLCADGKSLSGRKAMLVSSLGSIPAAVGIGALSGFVADLQNVNGSIGFTLVGPQVALICLASGINIIWRACSKTSFNWLPVPLGMGLLALLLVLTDAVRGNEDANLKALSQATAQALADNAHFRLQDLLTALDRMGNRWSAAGGIAAPIWESDASGYLKGYPMLDALALSNNAGNVYDDLPKPANRAMVHELFYAVPARAAAARQARLTGNAQLTGPVPLLRGATGLYYLLPLRAHGSPDGLLVASIRIDKLFAAAVDRSTLARFEITAREGNDHIFSTANAPDSPLPTSGYAQTSTNGALWIISVTPNQNLLAQSRTMPNAFFGVGFLIVALITLSSFLAAKWRAYIVKLQAQEVELKRSEETFRTTMESAPVGMALLTPKIRRLGANRELCRMLGYSNDELLTQNPRLINPEYFEADRAQIVRMLSGEIENYEMEQVYLTRDGKPFWVQVNASLARNADGSPKHVIKQILNIDDRKEMERVKSEFVSVVSHELRTPLTAIRGALGLMSASQGTASPEAFRNIFDIADRNCNRLTRLVNDILDMEKLNADRLVFDMHRHDLVALVRQSVEINAPFAQKHGVRVFLSAPHEAIRVEVDSGRFEQVLTNLLSNAAKFSHEGGQVEVVVCSGERSGRVEIRDFGLGMTNDFKAKAFGRFVQADSSNSRNKSGTGLGLYISKEITERMGGTIGFSSELGQGTTFWLEFPLTAQDAQTGEADLPPVRVAI
jgi:PAS domain S-box-containing protein